MNSCGLGVFSPAAAYMLHDTHSFMTLLHTFMTGLLLPSAAGAA